MDPEFRRWRCPECGREFRIPLGDDDPMVCSDCRGRQMSVPADAGASTEPAGSAPPRRPTGQDNTGQRTSRRRRRLLAAALLVCAATAVGVLVSLRNESDFDPVQILRGLAVSANGDSTVEGGLFARPPDIRLNPDKDAPLVALVSVTAREPVRPTVEIDDGEREWVYRPRTHPEVEHHLAVPGLRPGRTHAVRIRVESAAGDSYEVSEATELTTPPLPEDFPPLETFVSRPEKMEPGVTLFPANLWLKGKSIMGYGYLIALDERGEVVWYLRTRHRTAEVLALENGHLLYNHANYRRLLEVDLLGNVIRQWHGANLTPAPHASSIPLEADTLHHEILQLPSENLLALSTVCRTLEAFPTSESDPQAPWDAANVVGDVILEFTPDGTILRRWSLFDLLDPYRIGYGSLSDFWVKKYDDLGLFESRDWSHANAIVFDPESDAMIISVRHQDCLVKIDRTSGDIVWILGDHSDWGSRWQPYLLEPTGDMQWPYHQHGPELTPAGTLLMYDNGNYRARPFEPKTPAAENASRVVEFQVDEEAMTVRQVWEYRGRQGETFYCPFYCEADTLPETGNILITDGGHIELADGTPADEVPSDHQWARILEVTRGGSTEEVFEVVIDSGLGSDAGWSVYRSQRLPSLQPLAEAVERIDQ